MSTTSREAIELAAETTPAERVAAIATCPCGTNHRAGSAIAKTHAAQFTPALKALPAITGEDLRGVLSLWRGALWVRNGQPLVLDEYHRDVAPINDEPLLRQDDVIGLLTETGANVALLKRGFDRLPIQRYEVAAELLLDQLRAEYAVAA